MYYIIIRYSNQCFAEQSYLFSSLFTLIFSLETTILEKREERIEKSEENKRNDNLLSKIVVSFWRRMRDSVLMASPSSHCCRYRITFRKKVFAYVLRTAATRAALLDPPPAAQSRTPSLAGARRSCSNLSPRIKNTTVMVLPYRRIWRRMRDLNSRAGYPTYTLSRGASSPT